MLTTDVMFDALALEQITEDLYRADLSPAARREADALQAAARGFEQGRRDFDDQLRALAENDNLRDHEKESRRAKLLAGWVTQTEATLSSLEARARRIVSDAEAQTRLPALDSPRQDAAERHVRMILETTPTVQLPDRLAELAASDAYPDIALLLTTTAFGRMFLEARGARGQAADDWERARLEALRPRLSAAGQNAVADLPGLRAAARIPQHLRGYFDADRFRYRV